MNQYRMSKMLFFVISADAEKINMAINFAARRKDKGNEVRFLVFGPAEKFIADKADILQSLDNVKGQIAPKACIFIAEQNNLKEELEKHLELLPAGEYVSKGIDEGFSVITI